MSPIGKQKKRKEGVPMGGMKLISNDIWWCHTFQCNRALKNPWKPSHFLLSFTKCRSQKQGLGIAPGNDFELGLNNVIQKKVAEYAIEKLSLALKRSIFCIWFNGSFFMDYLWAVFIAPSDGVWNKFHVSQWLSGKKEGKIYSLGQSDTGNLFLVTFDGTTNFNINNSYRWSCLYCYYSCNHQTS